MVEKDCADKNIVEQIDWLCEACLLGVAEPGEDQWVNVGKDGKSSKTPELRLSAH